MTDEPSPKILVVDDDGDIRMALEMLLQYEGFEVWTARDGKEALARMAGYTYIANAARSVTTAAIDAGADDALLTDRVLAEWEGLAEPFFAVVHYSNVHYPYVYDEEQGHPREGFPPGTPWGEVPSLAVIQAGAGVRLIPGSGPASRPA